MAPKMLMIIVDEKYRYDVEAILDRRAVKGYTELPIVYGEGAHGKKLGSRLHPGANSLVFTFVEEDEIDSIRNDLIETCNPTGSGECGDALHFAVIPIESFA